MFFDRGIWGDADDTQGDEADENRPWVPDPTSSSARSLSGSWTEDADKKQPSPETVVNYLRSVYTFSSPASPPPGRTAGGPPVRWKFETDDVCRKLVWKWSKSIGPNRSTLLKDSEGEFYLLGPLEETECAWESLCSFCDYTPSPKLLEKTSADADAIPTDVDENVSVVLLTNDGYWPKLRGLIPSVEAELGGRVYHKLSKTYNLPTRKFVYKAMPNQAVHIAKKFMSVAPTYVLEVRTSATDAAKADAVYGVHDAPDDGDKRRLSFKPHESEWAKIWKWTKLDSKGTALYVETAGSFYILGSPTSVRTAWEQLAANLGADVERAEERPAGSDGLPEVPPDTILDIVLVVDTKHWTLVADQIPVLERKVNGRINSYVTRASGFPIRKLMVRAGHATCHTIITDLCAMTPMYLLEASVGVEEEDECELAVPPVSDPPGKAEVGSPVCWRFETNGAGRKRVWEWSGLTSSLHPTLLKFSSGYFFLLGGETSVEEAWNELEVYVCSDFHATLKLLGKVPAGENAVQQYASNTELFVVLMTNNHYWPTLRECLISIEGEMNGPINRYLTKASGHLTRKLVFRARRSAAYRIVRQFRMIAPVYVFDVTIAEQWSTASANQMRVTECSVSMAEDGAPVRWQFSADDRGRKLVWEWSRRETPLRPTLLRENGGNFYLVGGEISVRDAWDRLHATAGSTIQLVEKHPADAIAVLAYCASQQPGPTAQLSVILISHDHHWPTLRQHLPQLEAEMSDKIHHPLTRGYGLLVRRFVLTGQPLVLARLTSSIREIAPVYVLEIRGNENNKKSAEASVLSSGSIVSVYKDFEVSSTAGHLVMDWSRRNLRSKLAVIYEVRPGRMCVLGEVTEVARQWANLMHTVRNQNGVRFRRVFGKTISSLNVPDGAEEVRVALLHHDTCWLQLCGQLERTFREVRVTNFCFKLNDITRKIIYRASPEVANKLETSLQCFAPVFLLSCERLDQHPVRWTFRTTETAWKTLLQFYKRDKTPDTLLVRCDGLLHILGGERDVAQRWEDVLQCIGEDAVMNLQKFSAGDEATNVAVDCPSRDIEVIMVYSKHHEAALREMIPILEFEAGRIERSVLQSASAAARALTFRSSPAASQRVIRGARTAAAVFVVSTVLCTNSQTQVQRVKSTFQASEATTMQLIDAWVAATLPHAQVLIWKQKNKYALLGPDNVVPTAWRNLVDYCAAPDEMKLNGTVAAGMDALAEISDAEACKVCIDLLVRAQSWTELADVLRTMDGLLDCPVTVLPAERFARSFEINIKSSRAREIYSRICRVAPVYVLEVRQTAMSELPFFVNDA